MSQQSSTTGIMKNNPKEGRRKKRENKEQKETTRKQITRLKIKEWKKIYHANINKKKAEVVVLISDNVYFIAKNISRKRSPFYNKVFIVRT